VQVGVIFGLHGMVCEDGDRDPAGQPQLFFAHSQSPALPNWFRHPAAQLASVPAMASPESGAMRP